MLAWSLSNPDALRADTAPLITETFIQRADHVAPPTVQWLFQHSDFYIPMKQYSNFCFLLLTFTIPFLVLQLASRNVHKPYLRHFHATTRLLISGFFQSLSRNKHNHAVQRVPANALNTNSCASSTNEQCSLSMPHFLLILQHLPLTIPSDNACKPFLQEKSVQRFELLL